MSSAKTSLNGYKYGREPETETPFWGGESGGAEIDDSTTSTVKTWSSKKISDELAEKADSDEVYTKAEVDKMLEDIPAIDAYTKTETDALLAGKAAVTSVYTKAQTYSKTEVDNLLSQIPAVDAYTKAQTDSLLDAKANASDVYTKSQVDSLIPDVSGLATKTELNSGLAECAKVTSVYTKAQTYSKSEVDDLISGATPAPVDAYTKAQTDALLADKADKSELANYAKVTSVYTKAQTYTKEEVNELLSHIEPTVDAYTKAQTDALLADKADKATTYTKAQVDALISDIPAIDAYTKTQTDNLLADKADKSDTYTKTQVDNLIPDVSGLATKTELTSGLATKVDDSELANYAKVTSVYTKSQTYTKAEVDALIGSGGLDSDSLITFTDSHGLFRYTSNYGTSDTFEVGSLYNISGTVQFKIDGTTVYNGGLNEVPYNELATGATQNNISGSAKYLWKEWVVTYTTSDGTYVEIPVKIAYIGSTTANNKYNPYIHIIYPADCGHVITFECLATDYIKVPSESGGGGGLQEYAYTITSPDSTTISTAIMAALVDAITNVGIDDLEKLRKIVARTEYTFGSTPHVIEHIYDVKYTSISKGGGNFDDIDICAVGGDYYYSAGDNIKTTKLIASRYNGILNTVEQSGTNPIVTSTDHSSTNVDSNSSPWYHNQSRYSDLAYKLVFVYG